MFISHITDQSRIVSVADLTFYDKDKPVKLIGSLIFYLNAKQGMHSMTIYDYCCPAFDAIFQNNIELLL
ncbi:hypothetical protein V2H77_08875 [Photorhabdus sp. P32]|uniref:hypothetical protein n=1 Tax=Photorhabdus sp. P32 TaxID=3117549 RepID=UPI00311ADE07